MDRITKLDFVFSKAKERLHVAEMSFNERCYYACASNLYYSLFHFMHSVLGTPAKGMWEHVGIAKEFHKLCYLNGFFSKNELNLIKKNAL